MRWLSYCTFKRRLFISYCISLYCCSLWSSFSLKTLLQLKVAHNNILRQFYKLRGGPGTSISYHFVTMDIPNRLEVKTSQCQNVPMSKRPKVKTSQVKTSQSHNVPSQNVPSQNVPKSKCPKTKRPKVKTSQVKTSQVKTSQSQNVPSLWQIWFIWFAN